MRKNDIKVGQTYLVAPGATYQHWRALVEVVTTNTEVLDGRYRPRLVVAHEVKVLDFYDPPRDSWSKPLTALIADAYGGVYKTRDGWALSSRRFVEAMTAEAFASQKAAVLNEAREREARVARVRELREQVEELASKLGLEVTHTGFDRIGLKADDAIAALTALAQSRGQS